jgi:hypothetical protein
VLADKAVYMTTDFGCCLMTVPLAGGKPSPLCRTYYSPHFRQEHLKLLDIRGGRQPEFLFFRAVPEFKGAGQVAQRGLWVVKGPIPNVRQGRWIGLLDKDANAPTSVSADWKRISYANWNNAGAEWIIYDVPGGERPCRVAARIPRSAGVRRVGLSPDGQYLAVVRQPRRAVLGVRPVKDLSKEQVLTSGAITYGTPGWSPDGRFIAMRTYGDRRQGSDGKSRMMIVQVAGSPVKIAGSALGDSNTGGGTYDHSEDADTDDVTDTDDADTGQNVQADSRRLYQEYIAAYNRLTSLMSQGKGDTPEAQDAYKAYKAAKDRYEKAAAKNK